MLFLYITETEGQLEVFLNVLFVSLSCLFLPEYITIMKKINLLAYHSFKILYDMKFILADYYYLYLYFKSHFSGLSVKYTYKLKCQFK